MGESAKVLEFPRRQQRTRQKINSGRKGSVYSRKGNLWVDFYYMNERVREPSGLTDTEENRQKLRGMLDLITAEIKNGVFKFAERFPYSKKSDYFTRLEGGTVKTNPVDITFQEYYETWWEAMRPGMTEGQVRDYKSILANHLLPYFGDKAFSEFTPVLMKKFLARLKKSKNKYGKPLSGKRIQNIFIPLRIITQDAIAEHSWDLVPFSGLKLPKAQKLRVNPFTYDEWKTLIQYIRPWYRPYFELAIQTGMRPSEQVALKWTAIDDRFIYIELSRVRGLEKDDLKTEGSRRQIEVRPLICDILNSQRELTGHIGSEYVFVNIHGRPILQDKLRELWHRAMKKSGLPYRRMYETRHTFASWALAAGESPEWVARTLGHVDTSMIYRTYGRYIPNLTRKDGSAFDNQFRENQ